MKIWTTLFNLAEITPDDVEALIGKADVYIFDCNPSKSFNRHHVPSAKNVDPAGFREDDLPADRNAMLIFYCSDPLCGAAPYAARRARKMGFANVYVMSSGIRGWMAAGKPVESR